MRHVWVDAGNDADWEKLQRNGITGEFYAVSDPAPAVRARLEATKARRHAGGLYSAWNWIDDQAGEAYADYAAERLREIVPVGRTNSWPKIQLDDERHEPDTILAMLRRWREHFPTQDTSWTLEAMQGGWMSEAFVKEVIALRVRVVPQCYNGSMTEVWDVLAAARDLTKRGFPDSLITPFYDARHLPTHWDGFAFTMGRLP